MHPSRFQASLKYLGLGSVVGDLYDGGIGVRPDRSVALACPVHCWPARLGVMLAMQGLVIWLAGGVGEAAGWALHEVEAALPQV